MDTASELGTLGFRLYCGESPGGPWQPLNTRLIPCAMSGRPMGSLYRFVDEAVLAGVTYYCRLESVDLSGAETHNALFSSATLPAAPLAAFRLFLPRIER